MAKYKIATPAGASFTVAGGGYDLEMEPLEGIDAAIVEGPADEDGFIAFAKDADAVYAKGMRFSKKVVDGLPAHKTALVKTYVEATNGMLTLHFLPGYAPELNPDELVWSHMKRTGVARAPLRRGESLREKIEDQLGRIKRMPGLVRSFFKAPNVAYITDL